MTAASRPIPRIPGELGIWLFIFSDLLMFALLFLLFALAQSADVQDFSAARAELNQALGLLNTLVLLTSSWLVVMALEHGRKGQWDRAAGFIAAAMLAGAGFVVVKVGEYQEKASDGVTLLSNDFFAFYYVVTGIHLLHVLIGLVVLGFMLFGIRWRSARSIRTFESGACYWHMVDFLWIVIYPLFYLTH